MTATAGRPAELSAATRYQVQVHRSLVVYLEARPSGPGAAWPLLELRRADRGRSRSCTAFWSKRKVDQRDRFLHALNYCMLLPGPEAQQLATYIGWLLHGTRGGLTAGDYSSCRVLAILVLSIIYAQFGRRYFVTALFFGLKPAVMAIVVEASFGSASGC